MGFVCLCSCLNLSVSVWVCGCVGAKKGGGDMATRKWDTPSLFITGYMFDFVGMGVFNGI